MGAVEPVLPLLHGVRSQPLRTARLAMVHSEQHSVPGLPGRLVCRRACRRRGRSCLTAGCHVGHEPACGQWPQTTQINEARRYGVSGSGACYY